MSGNHIDTVTFDLWNTLIAHDESYDDRIREARMAGMAEALHAAGYDSTVDEIAVAYTASDRLLEERWATDRDMDTNEQVEVLLRCMGIELGPELVEAVADPYANAVLHVEPFLVEGAMETLRMVRDSGLRLALISNTGRTPGAAMRKVIGRMGLLDFFEVTTFSNEAGYIKPHPRIFELTLDRMGSEPGRTVHVGDHDVLDVRGARNYGMKSVRVLQYADDKSSTCEPDACVARIDEVPDAIYKLAKAAK
jgi:haloacid dehalogenase superfamily, subfamily IA, variant 1 with third motif having Dx(3-4)D or Dx(3-4)E